MGIIKVENVNLDALANLDHALEIAKLSPFEMKGIVATLEEMRVELLKSENKSDSPVL